RSGVSECSIHVHLDDVVSGAVKEVDRELHVVGSVAAHGRNQDIREVIFRPATLRGTYWTSIGAKWMLVHVVAEMQLDTRWMILESYVAHARAVAPIRARRNVGVGLQT